MPRSLLHITLEPTATNPLKGQKRPPPPPIVVNDEQEYVTGAPNQYPQVLRQGRPILQYHLT